MTLCTVRYKDKILGRRLHKNEQQWFIVGTYETHKRLRDMAIPTMRIPPLEEKSLPEGGSSLWLKTFFLLWGCLLIHKRSTPKVEIKPLSLDRFLRERCTLLPEDGEFIEARELWQAYTEFCGQCGYAERLLFKDFNDLLENEYGLQRRRKHRGKGDNKTGYDRIALRVQSLEEVEYMPAKQAAKKDVFFHQIDQIQREVLEHFPDFPFEGLL